jgi:hypothetical protein
MLVHPNKLLLLALTNIMLGRRLKLKSMNKRVTFKKGLTWLESKKSLKYFSSRI